MSQPTLSTLPPELLHPIALFVSQSETNVPKGPPTSLPALLLTCRTIYNTLTVSSDPTLYAEIFKDRFDFDVDRVRRRCGGDSATELSSHVLAIELKTRFESLNRIRAGIGCKSGSAQDHYREQDLWMAVFMMMENEGKNAVQLKEYALIGQWLLDFFVGSTSSASHVFEDLFASAWPKGDVDNDKDSGNALAMWLFWLCDSDITPLDYPTTYRNIFSTIISAFAIAGNKYPITQHWSSFTLSKFPEPFTRTSISYYSHCLYPRPPPIAVSAILGLISQLGDESHSMVPKITYTAGMWDIDWDRWIRGQPEDRKGSEDSLVRYYYPGLLDGIWEGLFTYTDFGTYSNILSNAPPEILQGAVVRHNLQVWKLREYFVPCTGHTTEQTYPVLPPGSAFDGFIPASTRILTEGDSEVVFDLNGRNLRYIRAKGTGVNEKASDVVLLGEGHSSWGDFTLRGRIRREDAFVSIVKQYITDDARAKWLYRGYVIGGRLVGRWRDIVTRINLDGYEGSFEMGRRGI